MFSICQNDFNSNFKRLLNLKLNRELKTKNLLKQLSGFYQRKPDHHLALTAALCQYTRVNDILQTSNDESGPYMDYI